jgi:hypothetical protein
MIIREALVNNQTVRHVSKFKYNWVVASDLTACLDVNSETLMAYVTPLCDEACQITVGEYQSIRTDILIDAISNFSQSNQWQQFEATDGGRNASVEGVMTFLEGLNYKPNMTKETNFNFMGHTIHFVSTEVKPE